ncbi:MAG: hypothetical protein OJF51_002132 [Nitrospira sp.]|nr:MAG: hypothetical protein OJF51_002132 [Nitrospira sp.]
MDGFVPHPGKGLPRNIGMSVFEYSTVRCGIPYRLIILQYDCAICDGEASHKAAHSIASDLYQWIADSSSKILLRLIQSQKEEVIRWHR